MWVSELNCGHSFTPTFLRQSVTYTHAHTLIYVTENSIPNRRKIGRNSNEMDDAF